jgi:hypothetical protein
MGLPIKQPPFMNVVAGGTCTLPRLDMGDTCDALLFKLSGKINDTTDFAVTNLAAIRVKLGGKTIVDGLTGLEIQTINKNMQRSTDAQFLMIHFADNKARTVTGEDMGAIDTTLGYSSFSVEVDIAAGNGAPQLECWMVKSAPKPEGATKALFRAYTRSVENFSAASTFSLSPALGSMSGNILVKLSIFTPNDHVSRLDVKKNGIEIQGDGEKSVIDFLNGSTRDVQTGLVTYDPCYGNNQSDAVTTVRPDGTPANIEFRATLIDAETLTMVSELYTVINRI